MVLEKTLESPLDCKEIQLVHPNGDQSWVSIGRTDAEAETPVLWPPHAKSWLIGKDADAGRDLGQEEKGTTENEMAGWHHPLDDVYLSKLWELVMDREVWHAAILMCRTRLSDWTQLKYTPLFYEAKSILLSESACSIPSLVLCPQGWQSSYLYRNILIQDFTRSQDLDCFSVLIEIAFSSLVNFFIGLNVFITISEITWFILSLAYYFFSN